MAKKRAKVSLNDDMPMDTERAHGAAPGASARTARNDESGPPARGHVHSVRPIGTIVAERFVVKAHLGRARLGERYSVVDRSLSDPNVASERSVVLHFLSGPLAQQTRLLQKLETSYQHPHSWAHRNLVGILGFGSDRGEYFYVTEELDGGTLRTILDEVAPDVPPEEETFSVLAGIGDALKYAHAKGVVHGDIRPENVFVTGDLVVKVLDLLPATLLRTVPVFPEDSANGPSVPDPRDDVYGLACVAYELFAGKHPFNSNTALEALAAGLRPAPILSLDPRSWSALVGGLALRRDQRTPSVAAFLADLGVTGRERLRRAAEADRAAAASTAPASAARNDDADWTDLGDRTIPRAHAAPASAAAPPPMAAPSSEPFVASRYEPLPMRRYERTRRSSSRWLGWAVVLALAAGAVYWKHGWLQEHGPEWLALGRGVIDDVIRHDATSTPSAATASTPASADAANAQISSAQTRNAQVPNTATAGSATQPAAGGANGAASSNANPTPKSPETKDARVSAKAVPPKDESPPPVNETSPASNPPSAPPKATSSQPPSAADASATPPTQVQRAAIAGEPVTPVAPETFEPEKSVVVVSESAPSAAITIRRRGGSEAASSFVWWTTDGTAVADDDYINLGARIEKLAAGEQSRTIYVPLVHDSKPEGRESFYVNVRSAQSGKHLDPAARVEVVIEDDD